MAILALCPRPALGFASYDLTIGPRAKKLQGCKKAGCHNEKLIGFGTRLYQRLQNWRSQPFPPARRAEQRNGDTTGPEGAVGWLGRGGLAGHPAPVADRENASPPAPDRDGRRGHPPHASSVSPSAAWDDHGDGQAR